MKKLLTTLITAMLCVITVLAAGCTLFTSPQETNNQNNVTHVYGVRMSMGSPMTVTATDGQQYIEKTLTANVLPSSAPNRNVIFTVKWGLLALNKNKDVNEYVQVVQDQPGSTTAKVRCYKSFVGDEIIITVSTEDGGFTDTCSVTFIGFCSDIEFDTSDLTIQNSQKYGGEHAVLLTNSTYEIPLEPTNIFDQTTADLEIEDYGWAGKVNATLVAGTTAVDQNLDDENNNGYILSFDTPTIEENKLILSTKGNVLLENQICILKSQGITMLGYTINSIESAYFYVTVKDTFSNVSKEFRFILQSQVESVTLNNETMIF